MGVGFMWNHLDPAVLSFCLVGLLWKEVVMDGFLVNLLAGLESEEGVLTLDAKDEDGSAVFLMDILALYRFLSVCSAFFRSCVTERSCMDAMDLVSRRIGAM